MNWTKLAVATLKSCARAGKSFTETAAELGDDCTRNMVAGKAQRLGVSFSAERTAKQSRANRATAITRWADPNFQAAEQKRRKAQRTGAPHV